MGSDVKAEEEKKKQKKRKQREMVAGYKAAEYAFSIAVAVIRAPKIKKRKRKGGRAGIAVEHCGGSQSMRLALRWQ